MRYIEKKSSCEEFEAFVVKRKLEKYIQTYLQSKKKSKLKTPWKKFTQSREGGQVKIRRFYGKDMRDVLKQVKDELGGDAVIMSNKKHEIIIYTSYYYSHDNNAHPNSMYC